MIKSLSFKLKVRKQFKEIKKQFKQACLIKDIDKRRSELNNVETNLLELESEIVNSELIGDMNFDKIYLLLIKIEQELRKCSYTIDRPWEPFIYGGVKRK